MLDNFIFSEEGFIFLKKYNDMFNVDFRIDIPDGEDVIFETKGTSYKIDKTLSTEEFKKIISKSIEENKNFLQQRFKDNVVKYKKDVFY